MALAVSEFLPVWLFLALNILSPGPNVLNTMTTAMGSGRGAGLMSAVAVGVGIGLWCVGMSLGMGAVFAAVPPARVALTVIAAALLVWFGTRFLRTGLRGWRQDPRVVLSGRDGLHLRGAFWRSLSVNATNPKALTTWIAIVSMFPLTRATGADIAVLCVGASLMSVCIHTAYALAFSTRMAAAAYLRAAPAINAGVGIFFIGFAVRLLVPLLP